MREVGDEEEAGREGVEAGERLALNAELRRSLHAAGNHLAALLLRGQRLQMQVVESPLAEELDELVELAMATASAFSRSREIARQVCPVADDEAPASMSESAAATGPAQGPIRGWAGGGGEQAATGLEAVEPRALRVLVIDDDPSIREILSDVIGGEGCPVDTAATAADGLRLFAAHRHTLVFTDLYLGPESGADLAERIKTQATATWVVLMTGWAANPEQFPKVDRVLPKPFRIGEIKALVRGLRP
jgi:CheY-like chemotaxis protein